MCLRHSFCVLIGALATSTALIGCTANAPSLPPAAASAEFKAAASDLQARYMALGAGGGSIFRLNPKASTVHIFVFRGGAAAKLGHNHVLTAPRFEGYVFVPRSGPADAQFDLEFRLEELVLDAPEVRSRLGGAFSNELSPADIERTRAHMLGNDSLQEQHFPVVRIHSLQIVGEVPEFAARVQVELHGQRRDMWVPLQVQGLPDRISVRGSMVLHQTDFSVQPISVLGGLLTVHDEVLIDFDLVGV